MSDTTTRPTTSTPILAHPDQVRALSDAASTPSLVALSYALRHPETWPEGFVWAYRDCTSCAIGLSMRLWRLQRVPNKCTSTCAAVWFLMDRDAAYEIFINVWSTFKLSGHDDVTPTHVADAIDTYLAAQVWA